MPWQFISTPALIAQSRIHEDSQTCYDTCKCTVEINVNDLFIGMRSNFNKEPGRFHSRDNRRLKQRRASFVHYKAVYTRTCWSIVFKFASEVGVNFLFLNAYKAVFPTGCKRGISLIPIMHSHVLLIPGHLPLLGFICNATRAGFQNTRFIIYLKHFSDKSQSLELLLL